MYHILRYLLRRSCNPVCPLMRNKQKTGVVFAGSLAIISLINLAFLLLAGYPGILTSESVSDSFFKSCDPVSLLCTGDIYRSSVYRRIIYTMGI